MSAVPVVVSNLANAVKAMGVVIEVAPEAFLSILHQSENALVVHAPSGMIRISHKYLTSYKGLTFYTKVSDPLEFLTSVELVEAKRITIPDL
ncbi:MAG: hypothetical protein KTR29_01145 [Rhodothermaceae bacterium]|nr:hypothetical protein [Rhodothermaceae bacterium]